MNKVLICVDSKTIKTPSVLGFSESILSHSSWLDVYNDAQRFREAVRTSSPNTEVWVYSSDEIDAINIAATCKHERKDLVVCLISFGLSGSLKSRATAAGIDAVLNQSELKKKIIGWSKLYESPVMTSETMKTQRMKPVVNNKKAFLLPIMSASGGSGKSTVSIMSSVLCQFSGYKTLLLDADLQFGDCVDKLDCSGCYRIDQLIAEPRLINEVEPKNNLPAIIGCPKLPELAENVSKKLPELLSKLSSKFDVIIVNTGSFWGEQHALLLEQCSSCLMLLSQTPSSIFSTQKALDLYGRCGISTGSIVFTINFCSKHAIYSSVDISCALSGVSVAEIIDGGMEVEEMVSSKNPIGLLKEKNDITLSLWNILERILPARNNSQSEIPELKPNSKQRKFKIRRRA